MMRDQTMNFRSPAAQFRPENIAPALAILPVFLASRRPASTALAVGRLKRASDDFRLPIMLCWVLQFTQSACGRVAARYNSAAVSSLLSLIGKSREND